MTASMTAWLLFTRLGEAQLLLPAMAAGVLWLLRRPATRPLTAAWVGAGLVAVAATTASKVAFIGWGVGSAALDFTGFSGHAMFAALVLPVLARIAAGHAPRPWPWAAIGAGLLLAAAVALSRVVTGAHSASEAVLGFGLGSAAALWALRRTQAPESPTPGWLLAGLAAWLLVPMGVMPVELPASQTHRQVTALSLWMSGRSVPYTRWDLHRGVSGRAGGARTGQV